MNHQRAAAFDAHTLEVLVTQDQVMILLEFVAPYQVASLDRVLVLGVHRDHADAMPGIRVDEVEVQVGSLVMRGVERDRARDQGQAQLTAPNRPQLGHQESRQAGRGLAASKNPAQGSSRSLPMRSGTVRRSKRWGS